MATKGPVSKTRAGAVRESLRDAIRSGRLKPGERIDMGSLCEEYRVSLTVVREALTQLSSERLVRAVPQHGFHVWPLSVPDLLDVTRVRIELETLTVRESVKLGDLDWESNLVAAHHRLSGIKRDSSVRYPPLDWMLAHSQFHAALSEACTSPLLKELRQQFFDAAELYRNWTAVLPPKRDKARAGEVFDQHREILDAALAHDPERAVRSAVDHIKGTTDYLLTIAPAAS